jgi:hypothetical protein
MPFTPVSLWSVGQKLKAAVLNVGVVAIGELQAASTATDAVVATNTADIATNTADIATNAADIADLQTVRHFYEGSRSTTQTISLGTFTTVTLTTVADPEGLVASSIYTVPETGRYMCVSRVRYADSLATSNSMCQGVHTSNADGPHMAWDSPAVGTRKTIVNARVSSFTAADQLRLCTWTNPGADVIQASLVIYWLGT